MNKLHVKDTNPANMNSDKLYCHFFLSLHLNMTLLLATFSTAELGIRHGGTHLLALRNTGSPPHLAHCCYLWSSWLGLSEKTKNLPISLTF